MQRQIDMKIKLLDDRVLVKMNNNDNTTDSGIILSTKNTTKEKGIIVAVSDKVKDFKIGDEITKFKNSQGVSYQIDNQEYLILRTSLKHCQIEFVN